VIQAGDPTATGTGGSTLGDFDDQFNPNLQHNRSGVLSMAKSVDDSNDSQFFVTDRDTRFLDSNHTIFGQLIEGDSVREAIQNVTVNPDTERPLTDVVIQSVDIFTDNENGLLRLSAPAGTTGSAMITVTASDGQGGIAVRQFNVTVMPDTNDNPPFLADIPTLQTTANTPVTFQLQATDLEGNPVIFLDEAAMIDPAVRITPLQTVTSPNLMVSVNRDTGLLTVTPTNGVTGTHRFTVGVAQSNQLSVVGGQQRGPFDLQVVQIVISNQVQP
jgi:dipeptidyl aminopeptidase/acylaminoacyl peptidase